MHTAVERAVWQRARQSRDPRFDGRFFVGVRTTGIYCRPVCPVRLPKEENVEYFGTAAAAAEAGYRPCLRCRPEVAPGTPAWNGTSATVRRAWRLIDDALVREMSMDELAARLGIGSRHLRRLFVRHLGASPQSVLHTRRLHFAKQLIDSTAMPFTAVALAAGFGSIRRFNDAVLATWGRTPTALRRNAGDGRAAGGAARFRLAYRPPYDWAAMLEFLSRRAIAGTEHVEGGRYSRTFEWNGQVGSVEVGHDAAGRALHVAVEHADPQGIYDALRRVRQMFDVDADPEAIRKHLRSDSLLRGRVRAAPGLRLPGIWDPVETVVRAIVGQQASVAGARSLLGRLTARFGRSVGPEGTSLRLTFPTADVLADAPLETAGLTRARAGAVRAFATAVAAGGLSLDQHEDTSAVVDRLCQLPGIGPWTAQYVAMRGLGDPDAFPLGDLGLRRATGLSDRALAERAERWRPWRAYAALYLWMEDGDVSHDALHGDRQPGRTAAARAKRRGTVRAAVHARPSPG
jgi:AraC family transcriptional regulator of adaptative response / DNA-3-methyladenine glycosylase II